MKLGFGHINKKKLLQEKFGLIVIRFSETMKDNFQEKDLNLFFNNINNLKIEQKSLLNNTPQQAIYKIASNEIILDETNFSLTIYHELFHMASSFYDKNNDIVLTGFTRISSKRTIGIGITEGYTQLLTERYFKDAINPKAYFYEKNAAQKLEFIIGKEKMESLYLKANLYGLVEELQKYSDVDSITMFLEYVDFLSEYLSKTKIDEFTQRLIRIKLMMTNDFLLECFTKKLEEDFNERIISLEQLEKLFEEYRKIIGTTLVSSGIRYNFTTESEIEKIKANLLNKIKNTNNQLNTKKHVITIKE